MTGQSDRFEQFESVDGRVRAVAADGEPVTIPGGWFGDDADWRRPYRAIFDTCFPCEFSVGDDAARVPRANALAALADTEDLGTRQAEVLLAYFDAEGVVASGGESVAVLFDPDADADFSADRWQTARAVLAADLDALEAELFETDCASMSEQIERRLDETLGELRDLVPDEGNPDIDALDDEEYERFLELRKQYHYYEQLKQSTEPPIVDRVTTPSDWARRLRETEATSPDALDAFGDAVALLTALWDANERDDFDFETTSERVSDLGDAVEVLADA